MEASVRTIRALGGMIMALGAFSAPAQAGDGAKTPELTSLLGKPLYAPPPGADIGKLERDLKMAREALQAAPDDPENIVWVGRRLGYLWRINEAVAVYTDGIKRFPGFAALYRHRGHRYITLRKFDLAIADLEKAASLMADNIDIVEQDGQPNAMNVALTTLKYNIYYHLGLARYLSGDYRGAIIAFRAGFPHVRVFDDNRIALTYWIYNSLCRLGRTANAKSELIDFGVGMNVIENHTYHGLLMTYKGMLAPDDLIPEDASDVDKATLMYGLGNWYLANGDEAKGRSMFKEVVSGPAWPAFGYIAAEAQMARDKER